MSKETLELIENVKKYKYLYDASHELYKNLNKRAEAWKLIGKELRLKPSILKVKWKSLRDCYMRHKRCSQGNSGLNKYLNWPWSSHMQFLDDVATPRSSADINDSVTVEPEGYAPTSVENSPLVEVTENGECSMNPPSPTSSESTSPVPKKKLKLDYEAGYNAIEKIIDYLKNKTTKRDLDGIDHLFLSYAETFRKFRPVTQAMLKIKLAEIFAQTELKELGSSLSK